MKLGRILLVMTLSLVGCCQRCRGSSSLQEETSSVITSGDNHVSETDVVEKVIGPSGGEVVDTANNLSINIPAGALNEDTTITINHAFHESKVSEAPSIGFLGAAIFGPSGLKFNVPVEVNLKLNAEPDVSTLTVYCYYEADDVWGLETEATVAGDVATFSVTHFSKYKCLNLGQDVFEKYFFLVHDAYYNSKPDSYITTTYREYLVNQKYVMDYYQNYGYGYYNRFYKPIGLLISGNYQMFERTGEPNDLVVFEGRESRFGNRLGAAYTGSGLSSWAHCVKGNDYEECEQTIIHILIGIDAEIIDPKIDVSCDKKVLQKGESATVNVYAHYENPANRLYPDFPMSYYILTFPYELKHLRINKDELILDADGRGSFVVTALDTETETVKVQWYYDDPIFNGYGAGYVTFNNCDEYLITGHVTQELEFTYVLPDREDETKTILSVGLFKFNMEYDLEGTLSVTEEGEVSGILDYINLEASLTTEGTLCKYVRQELGYENIDLVGLHILKNAEIKIWKNLLFSFIGNYTNDECITRFKNRPGPAPVTITGEYSESEDGRERPYDNIISVWIESGPAPLLVFDISEGTHMTFADKMKEKVEDFFSYYIINNPELIELLTYRERTEQTVELTLIKEYKP